MSRPNVVSVLTGYRFLEKFMFSFQTLHVMCDLACIYRKPSLQISDVIISMYMRMTKMCKRSKWFGWLL